jgi:DNA-binding CsgD family transcriptional regulator
MHRPHRGREVEVTAHQQHLDLIGRDAETQLLDRMLSRLADGGGALLFRGEPGIGKSALLDHARERARATGTRVLSIVGVESEAEFAFAGLHQLLHPVVGLIERLSESQRRALQAAFGVRGELEPDPFHVAVAAFQLLCEAADTGPLLLIVDDAHWLDRSSMGVLAFIARRLDSEPLALVAAVRAGVPTPLDDARLPTRDLERLSASAGAALLDRRAPELHPILRARVLAEAAGNPLALVELARSLSNSPLVRERLSPAPTTLTARLEQTFSTRLDDLSAEARSALLAAALDSRASLDEIIRCVGQLHGSLASLGALEPAVEAGLIDLVDAEVRFRHPLIRSAVRQAAPPRQIVETYAVLAAIVADPERRLWHRAMSANGADEEIATALEAHARVARGRGAVTAAGAALERAAALTADAHTKGARLLAAAEVAYELGLVDVIHRLLPQAEALGIGPLEAARLAWLQQMISGDVWFEAGATRTFVTIAEQMRDGGDQEMALRSLIPIAHRCWWTRPQSRTRQYLVDAASAMGVPLDDPRVLAVVALAHPEATSASVLRQLAHMRLRDVADPLAAMYAGIAAEKAGDFVTGVRFLRRAIDGLREQIRLGPLTQTLVHFAWAAMHTGDWTAAAAAAAEASGLARDTRQPQYGLTSELIGTLVSALRGTETDIEAQLARPVRTLMATKSGPLLATAHLARGAAALGDGRHDDAFRHLWPVFDESDPAFHRFMRCSALLDLVEAAVGSGQTDKLTDVIAGLQVIATRSGAPFLEVVLTYARPLLAFDNDAETLFSDALRQDSTAYPFLHARTLFSFGRWLRRQRRGADSRVPLRDSIELFDVLGAALWSKRARQELRATGETIGPRTPAARDRLTAQELQIAQLAAEGLSNRDIGERLFLSHRTVGGHLYRIFPKLDITGRAQLRDALTRVN